MTTHYDDLAIYESMLLDLPFREGVGTITKDVAKPHHPVTLVNTPTWTTSSSGLTVLALNGTNEYLQCLNASSADLGFTTGDYSIGGWFYWQTGDDSQIIAGRYQLNVGGWEIYTYDDANAYLTLRHHHAGGSALRSACYSGGWVKDTWHFLGISRTGGGNAIFYRNGMALITVGDLEDPEATTEDLVMGVRYSKDANWLKGMLWRLRGWNRVVTQVQWSQMYEREKGWFV